MTTPDDSPCFVLVASYADSLRLFRWHLMRELSARGFRVVALAPDPEPSLVDALRAIHVEVRPVPISRRSVNPWRDLRTLYSLVRTLRELRPRYVLSYTIKPILYGSLAARLVGTPNIYSMVEGLGFSFEPVRGPGRLLRRVIRNMLRRVLAVNTGVVFLNADDRELFQKSGILGDAVRSRIVAGTGIDLEHYACVPLPREPVFLMVGRLLRSKGVGEYLEAVRRFAATGRSARFILVGWCEEGPGTITRREVQSVIDSCGLEWIPQVEDIRPVMARASIYVLPSYREGLARTVLEAMSMGRAVIATDVAGCRDAVEHQRTGLLVPPKDPAALCRAMLDLAEHPERVADYGRAGRARAEYAYDVEDVNRDLLEFFRIEPP